MLSQQTWHYLPGFAHGETEIMKLWHDCDTVQSSVNSVTGAAWRGQVREIGHGLDQFSNRLPQVCFNTLKMKEQLNVPDPPQLEEVSPV